MILITFFFVKYVVDITGIGKRIFSLCRDFHSIYRKLKYFKVWTENKTIIKWIIK